MAEIARGSKVRLTRAFRVVRPLRGQPGIGHWLRPGEVVEVVSVTPHHFGKDNPGISVRCNWYGRQITCRRGDIAPIDPEANR